MVLAYLDDFGVVFRDLVAHPLFPRKVRVLVGVIFHWCQNWLVLRELLFVKNSCLKTILKKVT